MPTKTRDKVTVSFLENYGLLRKETKKAIKNFNELQNEKNVHDIRRSFRRINAAFALLPQKVRNQNKSIERYVDRDKVILKQTSSVRDIDIIEKRLEVHKDPVIQGLEISLKESRRKKLRKPLRDAKKLAKVKVPVIKGLKPEEFARSRERTISGLRKEIRIHLNPVLSVDKNLEEMHSLRKTMKKLRYSLELLPEGEGKTAEKKRLSQWQDILGEILDDRIYENYLISLQRTEFSEETLSEVRIAMNGRYSKFLETREELDSFYQKEE